MQDALAFAALDIARERHGDMIRSAAAERAVPRRPRPRLRLPRLRPQPRRVLVRCTTC